MRNRTNLARLLRINDAAEYAAISRATIYNEIKAGRLKLTKLGHASRIEIIELDRWIDETASQSTTVHSISNLKMGNA